MTTTDEYLTMTDSCDDAPTAKVCDACRTLATTGRLPDDDGTAMAQLEGVWAGAGERPGPGGECDGCGALAGQRWPLRLIL